MSEALTLFRANSLFRNFEIAGNADRVLIYLILFTGDCLAKIGHGENREDDSPPHLSPTCTLTLLEGTPSARVWSAQEAQKHLTTYAIDHFSLPGEPGFPMNNVMVGPPSGDRVSAGKKKPLSFQQSLVDERDRVVSETDNVFSADALRGYLLHARQELVLRLVQQVYNPKDESTEGGQKPSKWWLSFQRRKFMGKSLGN